MKKPSRMGDAGALVHLFRVLTEEQFDYWIGCLNCAASGRDDGKGPFTRDDRQKTISYWYLLMSLLEVYAKDTNPFDIRKKNAGWSDGLLTMEELSLMLRDRFKQETTRRYVFDLKKYGLLALDGRGAGAMVALSSGAIIALIETIKHWVRAFRDADARMQKLGLV